MKILLTNDDGIGAPGILALRDIFVKAGHSVYIAAPDGERSANSHAITWKQPLSLKEVSIEGATAYAVNGTPADCARVGMQIVCPEADFVVSGINAGGNTGRDTIYSGTVAGAMEAAMAGIPALAVSADFAKNIDYRPAAELALRMVEHFVKHPMPRGLMCNLNVPTLPSDAIRGIRLAELNDGSVLSNFDRYDSAIAGAWYFIGASTRSAPIEGSDRALLNEGYATVTYMSWRLSVDAPPNAVPE